MPHAQMKSPVTAKDIERMQSEYPELKAFLDQIPMPTIDQLQCPRCRQSHYFVIEVWSRLMMFRDGVVLHEDRTEVWDDDSYCRCPQCEHTGEVLEFRSDVQTFLENLGREEDVPAK